MAKTETRGDHYNCKCPHCGKNNHHVSDGIHVVCGEITGFQKACTHCRETIYYHARHEIMVTAYPSDLAETLRGSSTDSDCHG